MKTFLLGLFLTSFALFQFNHDAATPVAPPKIIAKFDKISNGFIINESILRKKLADGNKIDHFNIQKEDNNFFLIRRGIDAKGNYRSEAFRLVAVQQGGLHLILDVKIKWYTVCSNTGCWCEKIGNTCKCVSGGDGCLFGIVPDQDIEVVVLG